MNKLVTEFNTTNNKLSDRVSQLEDIIDDINKTNYISEESRTKTIGNLTNRVSDLLNKMDKLDKNNKTKLQNLTKDMELANKSFQEENVALDNKLTKLNTEKTEYENQLTNITKLLDEYVKNSLNNNVKLDKTKLDSEVYDNIVIIVNNFIDRLSENDKNTKLETKSLEKQLKQLTSNNDGEIDKLKETNEKLNDKYDVAVKSRNYRHKKQDEITKKYNDMKKENKNLENELKKLKSKSSKSSTTSKRDPDCPIGCYTQGTRKMCDINDMDGPFIKKVNMLDLKKKGFCLYANDCNKCSGNVAKNRNLLREIPKKYQAFDNTIEGFNNSESGLMNLIPAISILVVLISLLILFIRNRN